MFPLLALLLSALALFAANIVAVALELPWYTRPLGALRWLLVDVGSQVATWCGHRLAHLYAELARRLTELIERLWPAVKDTFADLWALLTAWYSVAEAFFRGWAETLLEYRAVQFFIHPTALFWLGCLAAAALMAYLCVRAGLLEKLEAWVNRMDAAAAQRQPPTPRGGRRAD